MITANNEVWLSLATILIGIIIGALIVSKRRRDRQNPVVILDRMRKISRWSTASSIQNIIYDHQSHSNYFFLWKGLVNDKLLLVAYGEVIAGINLENITREDIVISGHTIEIRLPQAEILMSRLDNEKSYVYYRYTGIFAQRKDTETEARSAAEQSLREAAKKGGILDEAADSAYLQLEAFLKSMSFSQIHIYISGGTYQSFLGKTKILPDRLLSPPANRAKQQERLR